MDYENEEIEEVILDEEEVGAEDTDSLEEASEAAPAKAKQMKNLSSGNVRTLTVPISNPNGRDPNVGSVVIWDQELSADLFDRLRNDLPLVDEVIPTPSPSATAAPSKSPVIVDKFKTRTSAENPCGEIK